MKTSKIWHVPADNSQTSRLESIAFSALGLAGAFLIAMATTDALHFAQDREAIIQALSVPGPGQDELARCSPDPSRTNLLRVHAAAELTHPDGSAGTPASVRTEALLPQCQTLVDGTMQGWEIEALQ